MAVAGSRTAQDGRTVMVIGAPPLCDGCPDSRALDVAAFQCTQAGNVVGGQRRQAVPREIRPAEVANEGRYSAGMTPVQEPHHPAGEIAFVEGVGNENQIRARKRGAVLVQDIGTDGWDRYAVGFGVNGDGRNSERIYVVGDYGR